MGRWERGRGGGGASYIQVDLLVFALYMVCMHICTCECVRARSQLILVILQIREELARNLNQTMMEGYGSVPGITKAVDNMQRDVSRPLL